MKKQCFDNYKTLTQFEDLLNCQYLMKEFLTSSGLELLYIKSKNNKHMLTYMCLCVCVSAYRLKTKPSGEQVIMFQLHGSTAVSSQFCRTP